MSVISWLNTVPAQADTASTVDDEIRSTITAIATGFGQFAFWPGSASSDGGSTASTGVMKLGEHRLSRASQRLAAYGDGYLSVSTIRNAVVHMGSTRTEMVAHPSGYLWYRAQLSESTQMVMLQAGSYVTTANVKTLARNDFPQAFASASSIAVQISSSRSDMLCSVTAVNASGFSSVLSQIGASGSATTIRWMALGYVVT